ncbi:adenosinetriphosphatase [Propionibacterium ruminifibrarum]|uniref:Adenosinetriphosphatase n=2 Tax=Propionibacterium ruminifibrarum TaxID=1962131 RepID=A0A375I423_9ACTN|nr:adenosinetriphosphatase [Propionibacterium ruminifibrarum]
MSPRAPAGPPAGAPLYPFTAVVGQTAMRHALELVAVSPGIGGVLLRGEKGTAKSTIVRSLAALLPSGRVRTLALGATEDRVVGGLDLEATLAGGAPRLMPGLLTEVDGGICYVDEVNLLDDHLVDLLLDAAASGLLRVEREGLSASQETAFSLVGSMNPEEGALRPQLLDRFGLCVDVRGETDPGARVEVIRRRLDFDADPDGFLARWAPQEEALAGRLREARALAPRVGLPSPVRDMIVDVCRRAGCAGHRADVVMARAARAEAALAARTEATAEDVEAVAEFVLAHRRRAAPPTPPAPQNPDRPHQDAPGEQRGEPETGPDQQQDHGARDSPPGPAPERTAEIGETFTVRDLRIGPDQVPRTGSGRRQETISGDGRGHYVTARPGRDARRLALDATLRAAAPHQRDRRAGLGPGDPRRNLAVIVEPDDWRQAVRTTQVGSAVILVVDASGSMGARGRMVASKGAVLSLLLDSYVRRDQVALVTFRDTGAEVLVPPTSSVELAEQRLRRMPVGGRTPLSAGLLAADGLAASLRATNPGQRQIVIVVTDGRANVGLDGRVSRGAQDETITVAARLAGNGCTWLVVDTEHTAGRRTRAAAGLAAALGARCLTLEELRADELAGLARTARRAATHPTSPPARS